jgi:hypothetical protein
MTRPGPGGKASAAVRRRLRPATRGGRRRSSGAGPGERRHVNFTEADQVPGRIQAACGGNYGRLAQIKADYDPDKFFRLHNNILPTAPADDGPV